MAGMLSFLAVGFLGICVLFPEFTGSGEPEEPVFALEEIREEIPQSAAQGEAAPAADIAEDAGSEETRTAEDPGAIQIASAETAATPAGTSPAAAEPEEGASEDAQAPDADPAEDADPAADKEDTENTPADDAAEENKPGGDDAGESGDEKPSGEQGDEADDDGKQPSEDLPEDTQAPVFLSFSSSPEVKLGKAFDIHNYIGYGDDADRNVDLEVTGSVDTSVLGEYPLTIRLTDDAGHTTSKEMKVRVVTELSPGPDREREAFSDFAAAYKTDETDIGIDISRWQGDVDFEKVKAAGCEFVYMRIGGLDDGELYTDRYFSANLAGAKAAGLKIGIYWHAEEGSAEEVRKSVAYLMKVLDGQALDFPIAYDWEDYKNFERYGMNLADLNNCLKVFETAVEENGYAACLYGSKNFQENVWTCPKKLPVWLAHYTKSTSYAGDYFMWQHSCTGRIDGIDGDVDLDVYYHGRL
ncbi:MAG: glycoside hydrolase family 25 [Lachnospiraceae bacterium]|nr:glycoside hydrolase family 25 [Lachnospiraceae bacterium]